MRNFLWNEVLLMSVNKILNMFQTFHSVDEILNLMKATQVYFPMVLLSNFSVRDHYKHNSVDKILKCDHTNRKRGSSCFECVDKILKVTIQT